MIDRRARRSVIVGCLFLWAMCASVDAHERRINTWLINGPYKNVDNKGLDIDYLKGEQLKRESDVSPGIGAVSGGNKWVAMDDRLYCRNQDDYVDLFTFFMPGRPGAPSGGNEHVVAYTHSYVWAPATGTYKLYIGASDGIKVWLNGNPIDTLVQTMRQPIRDEHNYTISLNDGWNRLLIKSANAFRTWGFYAKIADDKGNPASGLEYSIEAPTSDLAVTTDALPKGFTKWPYVWLTVSDVEPNHSVPSASPFRLLAQGGTPPYTWSIVQGNLPPGLTLDSTEGEILGTCDDKIGSDTFTIQVKDSTGQTASRNLTMQVVERPTKWFEDGKIGGLIHGSDEAPGHSHGPPEIQAQMMKKQGYAWAAPTTGYWPGTKEWPGWHDPKRPDQADFGFLKLDEYKAAFEAHGVRFGSYMALPDATLYAYPNPKVHGLQPDYSTWPRYLDFNHRYMEEWLRHARPAVVYLDSAFRTAPLYHLAYTHPKNTGWDFDPLYSVAKTVSPETLMMPNSGGNPGLDWRLGDCDVFSIEGMNDGHDAYWERYPTGRSGHNPKPIPNDSWRCPFADPQWGSFVDWQQYARVVVTMICEGFFCNLDHTYYTPDGRNDMHVHLGEWLEPRLDSLKGTQPGPLTDTPWGYNVVKGNRLYLHILEEKRRSKQGLQGSKKLVLSPLTVRYETARLVPTGQPVPFIRPEGQLVLDLTGIPMDPVDTIVVLEGKTTGISEQTQS